MHLGYQDQLFHIPVDPARAAVEAAVVSKEGPQVAGRWRCGFQGGWGANRGLYHVMSKPTLAPGHPIVTTSDYTGETLHLRFPER